jgi:hypothetical protein
VHCESLLVVQVSDEVQFATGVQTGHVSATPFAR